jgi:predicted ATP-binding protein involved in virulence
MHLHPRWQQLVVGLLQSAFPAMQMVFTTHSPQVLSTVRNESIRVVTLLNGEGIFKTPEYQTRGVESADVLSAIMGVNPVPLVEEARWLNDYRALIEIGNQDTPEAHKFRSNLESHFGANHPLILDCDRLIRFQAFKHRQSPREKG